MDCELEFEALLCKPRKLEVTRPRTPRLCRLSGRYWRLRRACRRLPTFRGPTLARCNCEAASKLSHRPTSLYNKASSLRILDTVTPDTVETAGMICP